jgi:hypothetical protein
MRCTNISQRSGLYLTYVVINLPRTLPWSNRILLLQLVKGMNAIRSENVTRTRQVCGPEIFDQSKDVFKSSDTRREFRSIIGYFPATSDTKAHFDAWLAPILYPKNQYNGKFDIKLVFRGDTLKRVSQPELVSNLCSRHCQIFAALVFGPSAVSDFVNGIWPPNSHNETHARKWSLDRITPGAIACCAIYVSFLLSCALQTNHRTKVSFSLDGCCPRMMSYAQQALKRE